MIPLRVEKRTTEAPVLIVGLIVATGLMWFLVQGAGAERKIIESVCELGVIPGELTGRSGRLALELAPGAVCLIGERAQWHTLLTSMFLHGGWFHLIGNMWFLWVFGRNVEDSMGRTRFVLFYVLSGLAATAAQIATEPTSPVPIVGASGAISGVMGAYLVLYPKVAVDVLIVLGFFVRVVRVPAYLMLGYWFLIQILSGLSQLGGATGGVAFWAHAGGFVAGAALSLLFAGDARRRRLDSW